MNRIRLFMAVIFLALLPRGAALAQSIAYPDLQVITPTTEFSIGHPTPSTRSLQFSHVTWNAGAGPLEIRPSYNSSTGTAQAYQRLYTRNSSGQLSPVQDIPIAVPMRFDAPSDYRFPLSGFWLYTDVTGSLGTLVATSPKIDFCMTEDFEVSGTTIDPTNKQFAETFPVLPNTPPSVVYSGSNCGDPNGILGLSVGWGDKYDSTDPGENIDITGLGDGVYWLRSIADPQHLLAESNPGNNITDTQIQISGNTVIVLQQQRQTTDSTPPTVTLTSPAPGASVSGTVTLTATATPPNANTSVKTVQFLVDGMPIGIPVTSSTTTYTSTWNTNGLSGSHVLTAQATATGTSTGTGFIGTAPPVSVTVAATIGSLLVLDTSLSVDATGSAATTPAFSTSAPGELLLAFAGADGPMVSQAQSVSVSGAGLNWGLVARANMQFGTAEIWAATAPSALTGATVTSTTAQAGYHESLTLLALHGASGATASVGAHASTGALQGGPAVSLTTTAKGSLVVGTGNDWDAAVVRTPVAGQQLFHQWLDTSTGDTYWVQGAVPASDGTAPASGTVVTLNDTAPTKDRWNFSAVEVVASAGPGPTPTPTPPPPDTMPPTVAIVNPVSNTTVSGSVTVTANATDNVALNSTNPVLFYLDTYPGTPLPGPVTANGSLFSTTWDTTLAVNGTHSIIALATDSSNNTATATASGLTVANPPPPVPCFILDATAVVHGRAPVTTPALRTSLPGERLFAFAAADGPGNGRAQTLSVSGGGLSWTLVKRANAMPGDAEIWTALAPTAVSNLTVTAREARNGYDMSLYVVAYQMVGGIGNSTAASAQTGNPTVAVTTTKGGSLLYAVGNDYDAPVAWIAGNNQTLDDQWQDLNTGDTYWVQNETYPPVIPAGTTITLNDTPKPPPQPPAKNRWNFVGVEILNDD